MLEHMLRGAVKNVKVAHGLCKEAFSSHISKLGRGWAKNDLITMENSALSPNHSNSGE
jgi:hypothetical protein